MSNTKVEESRIPDFIGFCASEKLELPYPDIPENENRIRTAAKAFAYPDAYANSQYPLAFRVPYASDAYFYDQAKGKKAAK